MDAAEDRGIRRVSLNFAVMRSTFADAEKLGAGALTRVGSSALRVLDRFTQIESLYRNNEKYQPEWVPRYACVEAPFDLVRVALAIGRAEGFVPTLRHPDLSHRHLDAGELERVRELREIRVDPDAVGPRRGDQTRHRIRHLEELQAAGRDPYAVGVAGGAPLAELDPAARTVPDTATSPSTASDTEPLRGYARVRGIRRHGGVAFLDLVDGAATTQAVLERSVVGAEDLRLIGRAVDTGDGVVATGRWGASRTGTPSLLVEDLAVVTKALHPVPFSRPGAADAFSDVGLRLRRRSTDLLVHPSTLDLLRTRVETPPTTPSSPRWRPTCRSATTPTCGCSPSGWSRPPRAPSTGARSCRW